MNNQAMLEAMFDHATTGVLIVNKQGNILKANPFVSKLFGYQITEMVELNVDDLLPRALKNAHKAHREGYFKRPKSRSMGVGLSLSGRRKDGSEFPVEISLGHTVVDEEPLVIAFVNDVSRLQEMINAIKKGQDDLELMNAQLEKKVKERTLALAQNQVRLKETNRIAKVGHWEMDFSQEGKVYWSDEYKRIHEIKENTPLNDNRYFLQFCAEENKEYIQTKSKEAILSGNSVAFDYKIITANGNEKHVHSVLHCEKDDEDKVTKVFGILQDITDQKKSEIQLQQSLSKERELNELKSRFVSMASHEFRTPLTSIMGSADIIKIHGERGSISKQEKHIKRIKSSVNNLTSILNDFLSLEKLESGKLVHNPEPVNLQEFMAEVCEEVSMMAGPEQKINTIHSGAAIARVDSHLFKNILINLLSNAIKYSPSGEDIDVTTDHSSNDLIIKVKDRGIGIPEEDQQYMFTRFFRASNASTIKGTGLGLTIVKRYLDLMGGDISFETSAKGTTFTVIIPQIE